jgi:hypothetical protein
VKLLQDRAGGVELVEFMRDAGRGRGPLTDGKPPQAVNEADIDARVADPRNDPGHPKFDLRFAEETQRLMQAAFPNPRA